MAALATPYTAVLGLSLLSTSHALFSQLSGKIYGTPQIIDKAEDRKAAGLTTEGALALWSMWFDKVSPPMVTSMVLNGGTAAAAAFLRPATAGISRNVFLGAAALGIAPLPWTMVVMLSGISEMKALNEKIKNHHGLQPSSPGAGVINPSSPALTETEQKRANQLLRKWLGQHDVRIVMYSVSWVLSILAFSRGVRL